MMKLQALFILFILTFSSVAYGNSVAHGNYSVDCHSVSYNGKSIDELEGYVAYFSEEDYGYLESNSARNIYGYLDIFGCEKGQRPAIFSNGLTDELLVIEVSTGHSLFYRARIYQKGKLKLVGDTITLGEKPAPLVGTSEYIEHCLVENLSLLGDEYLGTISLGRDCTEFRINQVSKGLLQSNNGRIAVVLIEGKDKIEVVVSDATNSTLKQFVKSIPLSVLSDNIDDFKLENIDFERGGVSYVQGKVSVSAPYWLKGVASCCLPIIKIELDANTNYISAELSE